MFNTPNESGGPNSPVFPWPGILHEIRVKAVRTANDDGSEPAVISAQDIAHYIDKANEAFARAGVRFLFDVDQDVIPGPQPGQVEKSTLLNCDHASDSKKKAETGHARNRFADRYPDALVIFYRGSTKKGDMININFSGWTGRVVIMGGTKAADYSLAHEIGHYLHLEHTFGPNPQHETEDLPDSRGVMHRSVANIIKDRIGQGISPENVLDVFDGDRAQVLDTPPDPRGEVFVKKFGSKCSGILKLVIGGDEYVLSPDRSNVMSYFFNECGPQKLSQDQSLHVRETLEQGSRRRLSSLWMRRGPVTIERRAAGASNTKIDQVATVLIDGMHIATAARTIQGNLEVSSWRIGLGGAEVALQGRATAGGVSEVAAVSAGLGHIATVVRDGSERLRVIAWRVEVDGTITRLGHVVGDTMSRLTVCRLDRGFFSIAGRDGDGNLKVSVWRILADGTLENHAEAHAGAVSTVSAAYSNPVRLVEEGVSAFQFVTPVRDASDKNRMIGWRFANDEITRLDTAVSSYQIRPTLVSTSPDLGRVVTASRGLNGELVLENWHIDPTDGEILSHKVQHSTPLPGEDSGLTALTSSVEMSAVGPDSVATVTGNRDGNLKIYLWQILESPMAMGIAAQASAGKVGAYSVCRVAPNLFVTPLSDSQQRLKVIAWQINQVSRGG